MFEKEAEEYREKEKDKGYYWVTQEMEQSELDTVIDESFKDGAEFGYNKAKEEMVQNGLALQSDMDKTIEQNIALKKELEKANGWHYVKDELPPENIPLNIITFDKDKKRRLWEGEYKGGNGQWWTG